jgi:hypothetical protein
MELETLRNSDDPRIGGVAVAGLEIKNVGEPDEVVSRWRWKSGRTRAPTDGSYAAAAIA